MHLRPLGENTPQLSSTSRALRPRMQRIAALFRDSESSLRAPLKTAGRRVAAPTPRKMGSPAGR
eukprot:6489256-Amphidinium_carterae.1